MKTISLLLSLCVAACQGSPGPAKASPVVFYRAIDVVTVDVGVAPPWAAEAAVKASEFWSRHGLTFDVVDGGGQVPLTVGTDVPGEALGEYTFSGQVVILPELEGESPECVVAHELGHSVRMNHVSQSGGMMSVYASVCDSGCCWNTADQAELERVLTL